MSHPPAEIDRSVQRLIGVSAGESAWKIAVAPVVVFLLLAGAGVWLCKLETSRQAEAIEREVRLAQVQMARRLEQDTDALFRPLRRIRRDYLLGRWSGSDAFSAAAAGLQLEQPAYTAVAWADADAVVRDVVPLAGNEEFAGLNIQEASPWSRLVDEARVARDGAAGRVFSETSPTVLGGTPGTFPFMIPCLSAPNDEVGASVPTEPASESLDLRGTSDPRMSSDRGGDRRAPDFRGAVLGLIDLSRAVPELTDPATLANFHVDLRDPAGVPIVLSYPSADRASATIVPSGLGPEPVRILNTLWSLRLRPTEAFVEVERGPAPARLLVGALLVALLVSGSTWFVQRQRRRVLAQSAVHQRALESLNEFTAGIGRRLGEGDAVMDQLARVAVDLTGMDMASVAVVTDGGLTFNIISSFGQDPPIDRKVFPLEAIPTAKQCIETGRVVVVPDAHDASRQGKSLNHAVLNRYAIRAIMQIPLRLEDRSIGALALGSRTPRQFTDADVRLAELFGSHAAVILLNNRLLQQTRRAVRMQKRLTRQRRMIYRLMASVYQARSVEESVRRVARLAPRALSVDDAAVCVPTDRADYFRVAGSGPERGNQTLKVGTVLHLPDAGRALASRKMVVVGPSDPWPSVATFVGANVLGPAERGSVAYLPLVAHDPRPIGVLVLVRRRGRRLNRTRLRTAGLLASRAAVAIEASQLHHRARVDASANATLLRELNHRVKNNLAGIAGLLSIGQPVLDKDAQQWLDRAIERINTMARAHELFTGGSGAIALPALIDQLMPTLRVLAPAGVTVLADVDRSPTSPVAQARLDPDRAVALAMVLHELCVNAIVHGLGQSGTLTVRASCAPDDATVVEVIDEGGAGQARLVPHRSTGMGLDLVRGLVERELSGTFTLSVERPGRTVASVHLPAGRAETVGTGV